MKLAAMQPYLFPYLGYFQLIHAVDAFVIYDDINYIVRGWINRNRILVDGKAGRITLETRGASPNKPINEVGVGGNAQKLLKTIRQSYARAPQFPTVFPLVEAILMNEERNLARFITNGIEVLCAYLGLAPKLYLSSALDKSQVTGGQARVLELCRVLGASHYINPPGGRHLYDHEDFTAQGVELSFIEPGLRPYRQFGGEFVPRLSIIDVMMLNDRERCGEMLRDYDLTR